MATLDVLSTDEALGALKGVKGLGDQARIGGLVTAISKILDGRCGPIVVRATVDRFLDAAGPLFLSGKASGGVVSSVTEAYSNETPVTVASTQYVVDDGITSQITRWAGYWGPRVVVTYNAGRFATTAMVEEPFKTAAAMLLQHHWRRSDGGGSETYGPPLGFIDSGLPSFGFPNAVRDLLAGELLPPAVA